MLISKPSERLTEGYSHAGEIRTLSTHFWTHAYRETGAPRRPSGRQGRALRQARGLQFGTGLRRQQAAQARIHHSRCDRLQRRYAGLDRGRAVEPHPHGGRGRGENRNECRRVQESWVPHEDAVYDRVGNILLSRIMGADVEMVDEGFDIGIRESWEAAIADVKARGGKPYAIPAGASVHKYGGLGYVGFAEEVRAQEKELGFAFDYIVVCTVTGSTHAGMLVGFARDGRERKVIGIDASFTPAQTKAQVLEIAQNTAKLVELGKEIVEDDVILVEDYAYPVYGVPSQETKDAIRLCARLEGMITDPVYEGKSMQGMIDLVKKGYFPEGSKVLYAHLGGAPAINGYAYTFRNG